LLTEYFTWRKKETGDRRSRRKEGESREREEREAEEKRRRRKEGEYQEGWWGEQEGVDWNETPTIWQPARKHWRLDYRFRQHRRSRPVHVR